ncbi:LexA family transcriptional regulator [Acinetobacter bereziniae]|uniref:LexA family transcriptional regulator n=1 Tax=Acinetobacter bereziniae TaxID=106648 RepID=UPI0012508427|nr:LexA family transcriptional regulator [Acinetobacter bereziniae]MCU4320627.1 LexA family transcriptional regulator [Acinetobacter bereziniae]
MNTGSKPMQMLDRNQIQIQNDVVTNDDGTITYTKKGYGEIITDRPLSAVRLELALDEANITQVELAEMIHVKQPTISRILSGKTKNSRHLSTIANILNKNVSWLAGLDQDDEIRSNINGNELTIDNNTFIIIREFTGDESNHTKSSQNMMIISASKIPQSIKHEDIYFINQPDRAMSPEIKTHSSVFFDHANTMVLSGDLYVIQSMGSIFTRLLFIQPNTGQILIRSKDADFPDFIVERNDIKIIGKVFMSINNY